MTTRQAAIVSLVICIISIGFPFFNFQVSYLNSRSRFFVVNLAVVTTFAVLCLTHDKVLKDFKHQANDWNALCDGHATARTAQK